MAQDTYTLRNVTARIIENTVWGETHVSGGGGGSVPFGGTHVSAVRSHSVERQKIWLEDDSGHQFEMNFTNNKLPCRQGHRLTFVYMRANRKPDIDENYHLVMTYNNTTGDHILNTGNHADVISQAVPFSYFVFFLWLAASIGVNLFYDKIGFKDILAGGFIMMFPCLVISYFRHRPARKLLDRLLAEEQERLNGLPRERAESIHVMGVKTA